MLKFYASQFVKALDDISAIRAIAVTSKGSYLEANTAATFLQNLRDLEKQLEEMKLKQTLKSVRRLIDKIQRSVLLDDRAEFLLSDIGLRLHDELDEVLLFSLPQNAEQFEQAEPIFGRRVAHNYQGASADISEAGKCLALRRSTACVFHLMRVVEVGIEGVRKHLQIPDPVKEAERNWGAVFRKLRDEMDRRKAAKPAGWTKQDDQFFSEVYASLDAVRQAWRNSTMHVENKYTEEEAEHILAVTKGFMKKLASRFDENGRPAEEPRLPPAAQPS